MNQMKFLSGTDCPATLLLAILSCSCDQPSEGLPPKPALQANPGQVDFQYRSGAFRPHEDYRRVSLVALLAGNPAWDGQWVDVEGVLAFDSNLNVSLYPDQESWKTQRVMNRIDFDFTSGEDADKVLASGIEGGNARVRGRFHLKSQAPYGWSSGTLLVHSLSGTLTK